ncbi:hypothetical protein CPB86DRAFT_845756, partial [Serendipita vermifera]
MRKNEPFINTYSPLLTYLIRSNTDVQCLLSGTAVKAILIYVTDYITKSSLKTHTAFQCIKSIYTKHLDELGMDGDAAHKLILKMVNALISQQEVGGPLIAAYMLGNGDHYTDCSFQSFNWFVFVSQVQSYFTSNHSEHPCVDRIYDDSVELTNVSGSIIPVSLYVDWIYRPSSMNSMCLYEFVRTVRKKSLKTRSSSATDPLVLVDSDDEPYARKLPRNHFLWQPAHPQSKTHAAYVLSDKDSWVINWVGAALPRLHAGNDDLYYMTMLILFSSWRSPSDLKMASKGWKEIFEDTVFAEEHKRIMINMNVLYECLDARDDLSAQYRMG